MDKNQYYFEALKAQAHHSRAWVLRAFALFQEDLEIWKGSVEPYRLTLSPSGYAFVHPDNKGALTPIEGADPSQALFKAFDAVNVPAGTLPFFMEGGWTTYGNLLFNATVYSAIPGWVPYLNDLVDVGKLEQQLIDLTVDDPDEGQEVPSGKLSISQYLRFCDAIGYLQEFTQLFTYGLTEKAITPPDGLEAKKAEVLEKYKDRLNDPLTQVQIYKELVDFDSQYLQDDDSDKFLISNKSRATVRRKLFLIQGAEAGLTNSQEMPLIKNSLAEGWEKDSIPQLIDVLRAGSFDRGSETELGGVEAKWLMRSTSNVRVIDKDCETTLGLEVKVKDTNAKKLVGRYLKLGTELKLIETIDQAKQLVGQTVTMRSPQYCAYSHTDYCQYCLGVRLSSNKEGVSMAVAARGGGFLAMFLGAMHAKAMESAKMDINEVFT